MTPRFDMTADISPDLAAGLGGFLEANPGPVAIWINSPGGDAMAGAAMMAAVERHGAVTAHVEGVAASAATLPMVAAQAVLIHHAALVMIHEPSVFSDGTADQLRETADTLDKMAVTYARAYARHTGHSVDLIRAWMKAETWLDAREAVELRFADRIEEAGPPPAVARFDYTKFQHAPESLRLLARKSGWTAAPPDHKDKEN